MGGKMALMDGQQTCPERMTVGRSDGRSCHTNCHRKCSVDKKAGKAERIGGVGMFAHLNCCGKCTSTYQCMCVWSVWRNVVEQVQAKNAITKLNA